MKMMNRKVLGRDRAVIAAAFAVVMVAPDALGAGPAKIVAKFTATMVGVNPGDEKTITIDLLRWSTDEEAQKILTAFKEKGDKQWVDALQSAPSLGYVWTAGERLGYSIRYARRLYTSTGGERVIIAIDHPLGSWDRPVWKAIGPAAVEYSFSVIELRVDRRGVGEGKASLAAKVTADAATQSLVLENYASAPVLLKGLKRIQAGPAPTTSPARTSSGPVG